MWVALIVLAPRLGFIAFNPQRSLSGNAPAMLAIADNLKTGRGFIDETGRPDGHFSPVYVGLLAVSRRLSENSLLPIKLAQVAFDVATALIVCAVFRRLFTPLGTLLLGLAVGLHPLLLYYVNNVNDECLLTLMVTTSFILLDAALTRPSVSRFLVAGAGAGLATMTKGSVILLPLACLLGCSLSLGKPNRQRVVHWMLYLGAYIAVLLPWCLRNQVAFGRFAVNPRGFGQNLWWGSDPRIFASYGEDRSRAVALATQEMASRGLLRPVNPMLFEYERWQFQMGMYNYKDMLHRPLYALKVLFLKTTRTLYAAEGRASGNWLMMVLQVPALVLGIVGWRRLRTWPSARSLAWLVLIYTAYFHLTVSPGLPMVRYFVPVMPLVLAMVIAGISPGCFRLMLKMISHRHRDDKPANSSD